jgi:hypothetical protein
MKHERRTLGEGGFALLLVLLLTMVVGALALSAVSLVGNASLINAHAERQAEMEAASVAGTELGRALVNRRTALYPEAGYVQLPSDSMGFVDALGRPITGYTRSVFAGPTGVATGQFGVFGSIVSVVEDASGAKSIFRREMVQESFAKYAYFTDRETMPNGTAIYFAPGDQLFGPVHSNDYIRIMQASGGPVFHGPVTTHRSVIDAHRAQFRQGMEQGVGRINLPDFAELDRLLAHAQAGNTAIVSSNAGSDGQATTRIEFVAIDLDGDGSVTGENEGFFKVYKSLSTNSAGARWVVAARSSPAASTPNCGHRHRIGGKDYFYTAAEHDIYGFRDAGNQPMDGNSNSVLKGMPNKQRPRCYLGGSDSLTVDLTFRADDGRGEWEPWSGTWAAPRPPAITSRDDADYLIPLGRLYNPNFKGVIHVKGKVAISGILRGRVTLATTGDIVVADDVQYATDPSAATCADILGLFAGGDIVVSDNAVNAPMNLNSSGNDYRSYDDTTDEVIHAVLLTLGSFTVANYDSGADDNEPCEGMDVGRGCLYVTGGIIQDRRGPVGQSAWGGVTGYLKRYSYDQCAATNPPPYYPTTGYFARGRIFEVNPVGFEIGEYFDRITAG